MTYPNNIDYFVAKIDKNASGWYVSGENFNVPSSPYYLYLDHVPKDSATTTILPSGGGSPWTEDLTGSPAAGEYYVNYDVGRVTFNSSDLGTSLEAQYDTLGDDIMAEHINDLQLSASGIEENIGLGAASIYDNIAQRLDTFISVGDSINASEVDIITPPGLSATTVQEFIDASGTANRSDTNPFGIGWNDIYDADGDMVRAQNNITTGYLYANTITASGSQIGLNVDGPDEDQWMYFYDNSSPIGQWMKWDDGDDRFEFSGDLYVHGDITASGIGSSYWFESGGDTLWPEAGQDVSVEADILASGSLTVGANVLPLSSGVSDIGTVTDAFNDAHIDKIYLENSVPTDQLQATTKQYVDDENLNYLTLDPTVDASEMFTGFPNRTDSTLSFNDGTRLFTLGGTFDIYLSGVKHTLNGDTVTIADSTNLHWIYIDTDLDLKTQVGAPGWDACVVAAIYYNTDVSMDLGLVGDERHGMQIQPEIHEYLHRTIGTRYASGLAGTFDSTTLAITSGTIFDEDIDHNIGAETTCNVLYMDGASDWSWDVGQTTYYKEATGTLQYNSGTALTSVPVANYMAMWVFATNDTTEPIYALMGQRVDATLNNARLNNTYDSLSLGTLPSREMKILYRVILQNVAGTTTYVETQDLRTVSNLPSGTYVATAHSTLSELNWANAGHTIDTDVVPTSSGVHDLGSIALAYDEAYIDKVNLEADPTTPLQAATKQYVDSQVEGVDEHNELGNLNWAAAGHTIDADIVPVASGAQNLGSPALPFGDAYVDDLYVKESSINLGQEARIASPSGYVELIADLGSNPQDSTLRLTTEGSVELDTFYGGFDVRAKGSPIPFAAIPIITMNEETGMFWYKPFFGGQPYKLQMRIYNDNYISMAVGAGSITDYTQIHTRLWLDEALQGLSIQPQASGTGSIGAVASGWAQGYFDNLEAANSMYAKEYYGDGSNLTNLVATFIDLTDTPSSYLGMSASGVRVNSGADGIEFYDLQYSTSWADPVDADIIPDTSGFYDIGSVEYTFGDAYFDTIHIDGEEVGIAGYTHTQTSPSVAWVVNHNLGTDDVIVQCADDSVPPLMIIPTEIEYTDANSVSITFSESLAGEARVISTAGFAGSSPGVLDHDLLNNLEWSAAGHTIDADIMPDASGTRDLGSAAVRFDNGYFNSIHVTEDSIQLGSTTITAPSGLLTFTDASGTYTLADLFGGGGGTKYQ